MCLPLQEEAAQAAKDGLYRGILYAYVPIAYGVVGTVCHLLCTSAVLGRGVVDES